MNSLVIKLSRMLLFMVLAIFSLKGQGQSVNQLAESVSSLATDTAHPSVIPLYPGYFPPKERLNTNDFAILLTKEEKTTTLDHTHVGGDDIKTKSTQEAAAAMVGFDMGAGARVSILHELYFRKSKTSSSALRRGVPREELEKIQQDALRITIELVEGLSAGMMLRYLYLDRSIYGDLTVSTPTSLKTTLIGYGSGAALQFKTFGFGYGYFPQLRGKTEVLGEEKIIIEPGSLNIEAFYRPNDDFVISLLNRRNLWELDDIDKGTTTADANQTRISLHGLDPDQYLLTDSLTMLGLGANLNKGVRLKLSGGQEKAHFNFTDLLVYNRVNVRQRTGDARQEVTFNRVRGQVQFLLARGMEISAGMGVYERKHRFPVTMNDGKYDSSGRELMASLALGF